MLKIKCSPLLELAHLLPMSGKRLQALPDIIDIRCGNIALAFYFYPVASWHWRYNVEKQTTSMNTYTPWACVATEITLPTMYIEYVQL